MRRYAQCVTRATPTRLHRTAAVTVAAVLVCCYAVVLCALAIGILVAWTSGSGRIGTLPGAAANRGVAFFIVACVGGAILLLVGARAAWRGRRGLTAIIPLAVLAVVGCVGETVDIASGNPLPDNLIGAGIIVLAVLPVLLLLLPRERDSAGVHDSSAGVAP
jgi:hypothetical protein